MFTLVSQLSVTFGCCLGVGLLLHFLLPKDFSPLAKTVFTFALGLFLSVLILQNLVYLGVPVRFSAWLVLGLAILQFYRFRRELGGWLRNLRTNADIKALGTVALLAAIFHSVVPIEQGLDRYYGKAGLDYYNYTLLAQYLRDQSYNTDPTQFGLRPSALFTTKYRHERIGQSIVQAEISVFSRTNAQSAFAATIIVSLTALAISSYALLRDMEVPLFTAVAGAFLPTIFQAITRLSIDAYLSQTATLFVFVFLTHVLLRQNLNARGFTVFFSLGLAFLTSAYSELMPFGCFALILGTIFARQDSLRTKRLTLLCATLLVALINPFYISDLIRFLALQYHSAVTYKTMNNLIPGVLSLRGWSEALFGAVPSTIAPLTEICAMAFVLLAIPGLIFLKKFQRLAFGSVLLPFIAMALYLATKAPLPVYPLTKLIFSFLPLISVLAFAAIAKFTLPRKERLTTLSRAALLLLMIAVTARGSIQEYQKTWNDNDLIESPFIRNPNFLDVCQQLEGIKNKKVLLFETNRMLFFWLCYHARNNNVFSILDPTEIFIVRHEEKYPFCELPKLEDIDLVVTHNQIIDPKSGADICLSAIDPSRGERRANGDTFFWLGPPSTKVYFLGSRPVLANVQMRLSPGPEAKILPVPFSICQGKDIVFQGEIDRQTTASAQLGIPQGISGIELRAAGPAPEAQPDDAYQCIVQLDNLEITDTGPLRAGYVPRLDAHINRQARVGVDGLPGWRHLWSPK
jgi:hypothetical protein